MLLRSIGLLTAIVGSSCTRANPDYCTADRPCAGDRVCDLTGALGKTNACVEPVCDPGEVLSCSATSAEVCAADQLGTAVEQCEFGCNDDIGCVPCPPGGKTCRPDGDSFEVAVCAEDGAVVDVRECVLGCADDEVCTDIDPSNDLEMDLDFIDANLAALGDLVLDDGATIDSSGTITDGDGNPVEGFSFRQRAPGNGTTMTVFRARSLEINGTVRIVGAEVVGVAAIGNIEINGRLVVEAGAVRDPSFDCVGDDGQVDQPDASGTGGGGFDNNGGRGGDASDLNGGAGGQSFGNSQLIPLAGGCAGGGELGGAGGGGLQLSSRTKILLGPEAAINAGGEGGRSSTTFSSAGGGGSGGGVLLEAPIVMIDATAFVAANGGAGGCLAMNGTAVAGANGGLSEVQGQGAECADPNSGDGGDGGARAGGADQGADGPNSGVEDSGGGGGGSVGRIRVNTILVTPGESLFSPGPSLDNLDTR